MRYFAQVGERRYEVLIEEGPGGTKVTVNGTPHTADFECVAPGEYSLLLGAASLNFAIGGNGGEMRVSNGREEFEISVRDEREIALESLNGKTMRGASTGRVNSTMPGIITRVCVRPKDRIDAGEALFIMEAMKMENEIRAETAGVVQEICVAVGETVSAGKLLARIGPLEE